MARPRATALLLALLAVPAAADCPDESVLSCRIGKKQLDLCRTADRFTYSFGPKGKPELTLGAAMADGPVEPWPGWGGTIWEVTRFQNSGVTYEVYISVEKLTDENPEPEMTAGVTVLQGDQILAGLDCEPGSLVSNGIFSMSDAMIDAGYCWNFDLKIWSTSCP